MLNLFREVFMRHKMQRKLGVVVNHRHMEMSAGERLVHYEKVATPWQIDAVPPAIANKLQGATWAAVDGALVPYELRLGSETDGTRTDFPEGFASDLAAVLGSYGLADRLGVSALDDDDVIDSPSKLFECTMGRATVTMDETPGEVGDEMIDVFWGFDDGQEGSPIVPWRRCVRCCQLHGAKPKQLFEA